MNQAKRIKLEDRNGDVADNILYTVLPDELVEDIPLIEVYVDTIFNPKDISKVVVDLNITVPIPQLNHLKRVKGKDILLFPVTPNVKECHVQDILKNKNFNISLLENKVKTMSVAKLPPKVRKQYEVVHTLWPCNFHSDKYLEKLSTNTLFTRDELEQHESYMRVSISVAKYAKSSLNCVKEVGVVVVDPKISSVVAVGYDTTNNNILQHAVMMAIDNVAKTQNGGAWSKPTTNIKSNLNMNGIPTPMIDHLKENYKNLTFGATIFKEKNEVQHADDSPYLCTGYYIYTTHEPCIMCAMALIHSRAKRVFFGINSTSGGLCTLCKVQTVKDLNHHYEVFGGLLESDCKQLRA